MEISQNCVAFSENMNFKRCSYWCLSPIWLFWTLCWKFSATPLTVVVLLSCLYVRLWKKNRSFLLGEAIALGEENRLTRNGQLIFWLAARSNLEELHNEAKIVFNFLCSFKNTCSRGLCFLDFKFKPSQLIRQCTIITW